MKCWAGVYQRDTETLTLSAALTHTLYMGVRAPGFEVFCIGKSRDLMERIKLSKEIKTVLAVRK